MAISFNLLRISQPFLRAFSTSSKVCGKIGVIGLGNMGAHMARNLKKSGADLVVYDVNHQAMQNLEKVGAVGKSSIQELAKDVTTIITMLPTSVQVRAVYGKIFETVKKDTLLIDSSTIEATTCQEVAEQAKKHGAHFIDAPVSGGVLAAENSTLTFMVGGHKDKFVKAKDILMCMGKNVFHCGDIGAGQCAKLCNNMLLGISMLGVSEALNLGINLGLDKNVLTDIIKVSSGRCWSVDTYNPVPGVLPNVPASRNYEGGFGVALVTKDLGLAQSAATSTKSPTPLGSMCHQLYRMMCNSGYGNKDFSSIYQFLQDQQKKE